MTKKIGGPGNMGMPGGWGEGVGPPPIGLGVPVQPWVQQRKGPLCLAPTIHPAHSGGVARGEITPRPTSAPHSLQMLWQFSTSQPVGAQISWMKMEERFLKHCQQFDGPCKWCVDGKKGERTEQMKDSGFWCEHDIAKKKNVHRDAGEAELRLGLPQNK